MTPLDPSQQIRTEIPCRIQSSVLQTEAGGASCDPKPCFSRTPWFVTASCPEGFSGVKIWPGFSGRKNDAHDFPAEEKAVEFAEDKAVVSAEDKAGVSTAEKPAACQEIPMAWTKQPLRGCEVHGIGISWQATGFSSADTPALSCVDTTALSFANSTGFSSADTA